MRKAPCPGRFSFYGTTPARMPDLPHGKLETKRGPLARTSFIKVVDLFQP
jgi:hypothetical protein